MMMLWNKHIINKALFPGRGGIGGVASDSHDSETSPKRALASFTLFPLTPGSSVLGTTVGLCRIRSPVAKLW